MPFITEYLLLLARDPTALDRHKEDPTAAMMGFGLTEEQQIPLLAPDDERSKQISTAIDEELGSKGHTGGALAGFAGHIHALLR